jgi:hypothetical protein
MASVPFRPISAHRDERRDEGLYTLAIGIATATAQLQPHVSTDCKVMQPSRTTCFSLKIVNFPLPILICQPYLRCQNTYKMETSFVITPAELNSNFLASIKKMFKNKGQLQVTITDSEDFGLYKKETAEEYFERLEARLKDLDGQKNSVSFAPDDFDQFVKEHI